MKQVYCQGDYLLVLMSKITIMNICGPLLLLSLLATTACQTFWGSITSTSPYTASTVSHALVFNFVNFSYPALSYLQAGYSNNWGLTAVTIYNSSADFCENGCSISSATRAINGQNIRINSLLQTLKSGANFTVKISLLNIKAPSSAGNQTITLSIYDQAGTQLATTTVVLTIYASLMTCTAVPTSKLVDAPTIYTFTVTPNANLPLPKDGNLTAYFPTRWSNSAADGSLAYTTCTGSSTPICSLTGTAISATNLFSTTTTSTAFTFTLDSVKNPGSEQPNYDLALKYYNADGSVASECQVTISGLVAANLTIFNSSLASRQFKMSFSSPVNILPEDEMSILFPSDFSLSDVYELNLLVNGSESRSPIVRPSSNTLVLAPVLREITNPQDFTGTNFIRILFIYLKRPTPATASLTMMFKRNGYALAYGVCCSQNLSASQNMTATLRLSNYKMQVNSDYRINFTLTYYSMDYFLVDFCSPFTLTPAATYTCYFALAINSSQLTCTALNNSQLKVALTNVSAQLGPLLMGCTGGVELVVVGMSNPSQSSCSVKVGSYYLPATQLEYSPVVGINYISVKMLNAKVTASSTTVNAVTSYTFSINNTNSLLANSFLLIYFPSSFNLSGLVCSYNSTGTNCPFINASTTALNFSLPPVPISQYTLSTYTLTVSNVRNPPSLRPTSSFTLSLQSGTNILESVSEGVVVTMNTLTNFTTPPTLLCSSYQAGALASYTFSLNHSIPLTTSNTITLAVTLPSAYVLAACSACTAYSTFTITNASNSSVVLSNVYNPETITVSTGIVLSLYVDGYLAIQDTIASPTFTVTPLTFTLTHNHTFLGEPLLITLAIPFLPLSASSLIITVPSGYDVTGLTLWSQGSAKVSPSRIGNVVTVSLVQLNTNNVTLQIGGVISPTVTLGGSWILTVNNGTGVLMANASGGVFSAVCGANCRQCVNTTYCLSCYNNSLVFANPYLDNSTHTCITGCSSSQFSRLAICYPCSSACLTCSISADNCTSCASPFFQQVSVCVSVCSAGFYTSGRFCIACSNNCLTCNSTSCISCSTNYVLQTNFSCLLTCPAGQYNSSHICQPCMANCSTCDWQGCTACIAGSYLISWPTIACLSLCPQDYYFNATHCSPCGANCSACSLSATNCTQCSNISANPYLYAYSCLSACPAATFADTLKQCQSCPSNCLNCSGPNFCLVCASPYLLYATSGQCLSSCFNSTINSSGQCLPCVSPCLTCEVTTSNCTSCIETYFLFSNNFTCTTNCGALLAVQGLCTSCVPPCLTCNSPLNPSICQSCRTGYLYYGGACWSSCPNHTYASSPTNCSACTAPCASCSVSPTNCTSCYFGGSIMLGVCYSPCPPTYFSYLGGCSQCQPQCVTCPYSQPNQCSSCLNSSYYYNPVTYECTLNCTSPYYYAPSLTQCRPCELPCKTCLINYNACASCYSTLFLNNSQCIGACPVNNYAVGGVCLPCPSLCASCDMMKCLTCVSGTYFYMGACYNTCPPAASNVYLGFCRNCLRAHCLLCNSQSQCIYCESGYLSYSADCVSVCPQNYEPDTLTNTRCVLQPAVAYTRFISKLQNSKILVFPATLFFLLTLFLLPFAANRLFGFAVLLAVPQTVAVVQLALHLWMQGALLPSDPLALPQWAGMVGVGLQLGLSWVGVRQMLAVGDERRDLAGWMGWGSNRGRWKLVVGMSLLNKQVSFLLFSGFFGLPFTSLRYQPDRRLTVSNSLFLCLFELPMLALSLLVAVAYRTVEFNSKLFYSSSDAALIFAVSICFQIALLKLADSQQAPPSYEKYVLPGVSNRSLPAYSDPNQQAMAGEQDPKKLHRSNSQEDVFESSQMKAVDYMSVLDPQDFYDETPKMRMDQVEDGLQKGDFRKKNKKKRGHRRDGRLAGGLDIIDQEDEDELMGKRKDKKKKKKEKEDVGGLHNFIYWKKPKEKKPNPGKIFHENEQSIMSRIHEKESQFDSITQNDIIFQDEPDDESSVENYNELMIESRRALQPNYDNYFNLNYAERQHLD